MKENEYNLDYSFCAILGGQNNNLFIIFNLRNAHYFLTILNLVFLRAGASATERKCTRIELSLSMTKYYSVAGWVNDMDCIVQINKISMRLVEV